MQRVLLPSLALFAAACGGFGDPLEGQIPFDPDRPPIAAERTVDPYTGSDPTVLEAQSTLRTGYDFHRQVIQRTCTPFDNVCHNRKEYPDLRTTEQFLATISAPCNMLPKHWSTVFDRCEQAGDYLNFQNDIVDDNQIAWIELIPGDNQDYGSDTGVFPTRDSAGLHIYLADPIIIEQESFSTTVRAMRDGVQVASFQSRFWVLPGARQLFAEVPNFRRDAANNFMAAGVHQGDQNRNNVFGASATLPVQMIIPGNAGESYFLARVRGQLVDGTPVPGTRMPLANQLLDLPEYLALACFIEGLGGIMGPVSLSWEIDYKNCSYSADPSVLDVVPTGTGFDSLIGPMLAQRCGGSDCHGPPNPKGGLDLVSEGAYARLVNAPSEDFPGIDRVEPGDPDNSYLYQKLINAPGIDGVQMPIDQISGLPAPMSAEDLDLIHTWILNGALQD